MRRIGLAAAGAVLLATAVGGFGCAEPIPPGQVRDTTGDVMPIFESNRIHSMHLTYYLASLEQEGDEVTIDLDLSNGFGHFLGAVTTWVTFFGADGESLAHSHAVGPMAPHATHLLVVEVEGVEFAVDDIEVGVQVSP